MIILYFICLIIFLAPICILFTQQLYTICVQYLILSQFKIFNQKNTYSYSDLHDLTSIYIQRKQWIRCITLLENQLIKDKQSNTEYFNLIGLCYFKMNFYEYSEYFYKQVLKEEPQNTISLLGIAQIYIYTKRKNEASHLYSEILSIDPDNYIAIEAINKFSKNNLSG